MFRLGIFAAIALSSSTLLLLDASLKGSLVLLLAAGVALLLQRDSAATRHLVWLVAVVAMLVLPFFSALLPSWRVLPTWAALGSESLALESADLAMVSPVKKTETPQELLLPDKIDRNEPTVELAPHESPVPAMTQTPVVSQPSVSMAGQSAPYQEPGTVSNSTRPVESKPTTSSQSQSAWHFVTWLWAGGALLLALRLACARLLLWSCEKRGRILAISGKDSLEADELGDAEQSLVRGFQAAVQRLQIRSQVRLLLHPERSIPIVWGLWRARLLLPETAKDWSPEQLRSVLLHELAHIKRRDTLTQLLAQFACTVYWFNPLVWIAAWRLHVERERACDDLVLSHGVPASSYAEHLLDVATRLTSSRWNQACGLAMARRSSLEGRLLAVLSETHNRRTLTSLVIIVSLLLGAATAIPLAMLKAADPVSPTLEGEDEQQAPDGVISLSADTVRTLQWSEPANGLRAALSRLPSLGGEKIGYSDFDLVIENVSDAPIRLIANQDSPDQRMIRIRKDGITQLGLRSAQTSDIDVTLEPGKAVVLPVFSAAESAQFDFDGKSYADEPDLSFYGIMEILQAPAGAWSGKLRTPIASGAVISGKNPTPSNRLSAEFEQKLQWGETVDGLRAAVMIRDISAEEQEICFVVQNVSDQDIQLDDSDEANEHTLFEKLDGELQSGFSSKLLRFGQVQLRPGEVAFLSVFPPRADPGRPLGDLMSEILIKTKGMTAVGEIQFLKVPEGTWSGKLRTGETTGLQAAPPNLKLGEPIDAATEQRLRWGEAANGLRAALAVRDSEPDLYLVVQNVQDTPVHLHDQIAATGNRVVVILQNEMAQSQTRFDQPTMAHVLLQPREVVYLAMAPRVVPNSSGKSKGQLLARALLNKADMRLFAEMTVAQTRPGAWTGTLQTGITDSKAASPGPRPNSKTAEPLFEQWVANARLNGMIPGGQLRSLAQATNNFVNYNPTHESTPGLSAVLKRIDVGRDWTPKEAVQLLNEITNVYDNLPEWAMEVSRFDIADSIRTGEQFPESLENAPWGENHESGLRTAWLLDPQAEAYRLNTPLQSRILYHNHGTKTVFFRVVSWNQSAAHLATDADGNAIETRSTRWTTIGQVMAVRLAPGEFTEVVGAGIGVGPNLDQEHWRNTRVGTWIHAEAGDEVTFTPDEVTLSGSDGRQRNVKDDEWWISFITNRLEREAPLPKEEAEREQLLRRVMRDLFGVAPTDEERETFLSDTGSEALTRLAERLANLRHTAAVYGTLQSGSTKFQVLPVDPEANEKPFLAIGPGRYQFDSGATLVIVGRGSVMDAKLEFPDGQAAESYPITLPKERGTWSIAWKRDLDTIWIVEPGTLRKVDFSEPRQLKEFRYSDPGDALGIPKHFLGALKPKFTLPKVDSDPAAAPAADFAPAAVPAEAAVPTNADEKPAPEADEAKVDLSDAPTDDLSSDDLSLDQEDPPKLSGLREGPVRSATSTGRYKLSNDRILSMCRPLNKQPWLTITWPESKAWPKCGLRMEPELEPENYRNWVAVWEAEGDYLWFVDDVNLTRVDVSNPAEVLVTRQGHTANAVLKFNIPDRVKAEFTRLGFTVGDYDSGLEVTDGQEMLTATATQEFRLGGTVRGANGAPMANVPVRVRSALFPTQDIATSSTDEAGQYQIRFRLDLRTLARYRGISVDPVLDDFTVDDFGASGRFEALLREGEKPQRVKIRNYPPMWITGVVPGEDRVGPIPRFGERDLIIGKRTVADFRLLPASTLKGKLHDLDGEPLAGHFISVTAPDAVVPRGYETQAHTETNAEGLFTLRNVPANQLLNFEVSTPNPSGRKTQESATKVFGDADTYKLLIEADFTGARNFLNIERL